LSWRFFLGLLQPSPATVTVCFTWALSWAAIAVDMCSLVLQRLELAAKIEREPSGRIRSRRRIGTSGIVLNVVEVMFS
jgi:hypothetical protein